MLNTSSMREPNVCRQSTEESFPHRRVACDGTSLWTDDDPLLNVFMVSQPLYGLVLARRERERGALASRVPQHM